MTTTDIGDFGSNTPLYFALDGLTVNTEVPTSLPNTSTLHSAPITKIIQNGRILIYHDGKWYDMMGIAQ
jgi:hypothetical protein